MKKLTAIILALMLMLTLTVTAAAESDGLDPAQRHIYQLVTEHDPEPVYRGTNAMGFPVDYIIDNDYTGREYKKTSQVARCGNAVCPPMAEAVVRANLQEWCGGKITTMEELRRHVAV